MRLGRGRFRAGGRRALPCLEQGSGSASLAQLAGRHRRGPGREFAFSRTELIGGTIVWRYVFTPEGSGTRVTESYEVTKPIPLIGWLGIGGIYGLKDRRSDLRRGMSATLERLAVLVEQPTAAE